MMVMKKCGSFQRKRELIQRSVKALSHSQPSEPRREGRGRGERSKERRGYRGGTGNTNQEPRAFPVSACYTDRERRVDSSTR